MFLTTHLTRVPSLPASAYKPIRIRCNSHTAADGLNFSGEFVFNPHSHRSRCPNTQCPTPHLRAAGSVALHRCSNFPPTACYTTSFHRRESRRNHLYSNWNPSGDAPCRRENPTVHPTHYISRTLSESTFRRSYHQGRSAAFQDICRLPSNQGGSTHAGVNCALPARWHSGDGR